MKRPNGLFLAAVGLYLTFIFHIGAMSVFLGLRAARLVLPRQYEPLMAVPIFIAGIAFLIVLVVGLVACNPLAVRISGVVFVVGLFVTLLQIGLITSKHFQTGSPFDSHSLGVLVFGFTLSLAGAVYLLRPSFIVRCRDYRAQRLLKQPPKIAH